MVIACFILSLLAGLLWIPYTLQIGPTWWQYGTMSLCVICGICACALGFRIVVEEWQEIKKKQWRIDHGLLYSALRDQTYALRDWNSAMVKEFFGKTILWVEGMGGFPIVYSVSLPTGKVSLNTLDEYLLACEEVYDRTYDHELWPIRDHDPERFGPNAEEHFKMIIAWLQLEGYIHPAAGSRSARWRDGHNPSDLRQELGIDV